MKATTAEQHDDSVDATREYGLDDLLQRDIERFVSRLRSHYRKHYPDLSIQAIHVVGSWARDEAMRGMSDLDVRVITLGPMDRETVEEIRDELKGKPEWTPEGAQYPDVVTTAFEPGPETPSEAIYS